MLNKIANRLRESRQTSAQIQIVATEILSLKTREGAATLFGLLGREPSEDLTSNLLDVFRELAMRNAAWTNILKKSISKRGRCPDPLRPAIREMLQNEGTRLAGAVRSVRALLADLEKVEEPVEEQIDHRDLSGVEIERKTQWFRSGKVRATVPISTDLSDIRRMEALASVIGEMTPPPDELVLDFSDVTHVYVVGLAALAAWCRKNSIVPQIVNASDTTWKYLDAIGFTRASGVGISPYSESGRFYAMAIEPLGPDCRPETVATRLVEIVDRHMYLSKRNFSALLVVFAELIENIERHAGETSAAFACAQVYPQKHKLTICVVDTGMGIRGSILSASNENLIKRVEQGESAVRLACAPLVTSKPEKHSGYGLYVASDLIVRNGGTFRVFSGKEIFTCYRKQWRRMEHLAIVDAGWNGVWIALIVDLDATLSVEDVYVTLPPAPGVELQDFF